MKNIFLWTALCFSMAACGDAPDECPVKMHGEWVDATAATIMYENSSGGTENLVIKESPWDYSASIANGKTVTLSVACTADTGASCSSTAVITSDGKSTAKDDASGGPSAAAKASGVVTCE